MAEHGRVRLVYQAPLAHVAHTLLVDVEHFRCEQRLCADVVELVSQTGQPPLVAEVAGRPRHRDPLAELLPGRYDRSDCRSARALGPQGRCPAVGELAREVEDEQAGSGCGGPHPPRHGAVRRTIPRHGAADDAQQA
jgi:hypothetical protein